MGLKYTTFRLYYFLAIKSGLYSLKFPTGIKKEIVFSKKDWLSYNNNFLNDKNLLPKKCHDTAARVAPYIQDIKKGYFIFFSIQKKFLGKNYDWFCNPETGKRFSETHWTKIPDFSKAYGDIKFVWEKARFGFILDFIRYDWHSGIDQSQFILREIESFIDCNPVNIGPNWKCSQEMSIRLINWSFALHYYSNSINLDNRLFQKIMNSIYWHLDHIYKNINFSRIAVRNNHAITETLMLYLSRFLFPFFDKSKEWSRKGKKWFLEEIDYQIYEDGTYLQFSMNYHRVVVQLMTLAIAFAKKNNDSLPQRFYEKGKKSLSFLCSSMQYENGYLPNYGANDGALFFKLNDADFRDFRPQLQALAYALNQPFDCPIEFEDYQWMGFDKQTFQNSNCVSKSKINHFPVGGYSSVKLPNSFTFIRCGSHKDRPSQADNLHLDIWVDGKNIFRDAGTFKYNVSDHLIKYYFGTRGHNTVMLGDNDQMEKGERFIWYNWTQAVNLDIKEEVDRIHIKGAIQAFKQLGNGIIHFREVIINKSGTTWKIKDSIENKPKGLNMIQIWHPNPAESKRIDITAYSGSSRLERNSSKGWYSSVYGVQSETEDWFFETNESSIVTKIKLH
jgi:hypothetical protein